MMLALSVRFEEHHLIVELDDARSFSVPLRLFKRLEHATPEQLADWRLIGGGEGIHWPALDEDISVVTLIESVSIKAIAQRYARENMDSIEWLAKH